MKKQRDRSSVDKISSQGQATRTVAIDVILQVLKSRYALDDVVEGLAREAKLDPRDTGLVRAIATVVFRRYGSLRAIIERRLEQGALHSERLLALLMTGAAQILYMDVPDRAAVDLSVHIANDNRGLRPFSGLVNAVLRRIARERVEIEAEDDPKLDVPEWLFNRWRDAYGEEAAIAIIRAHREGASVDLSLKADAEHWAVELNADILETGSLRLRDKTPIRELPGFDGGNWWIQDAAAALPARLIAPQTGERIADLCAAPGGKTAQLAAAGASVVAADRSAQRLKRLEENMSRLGLDVEVLVADVLTMEAEPFDAVLLDAPCSATGTLRRHPEIAWIKAADDIVKLADLQRRLLDKAADLVRPGGRLVYCTCSLETEEGEDQISAFLARHSDFSRVPVTADEISLQEAVTAEGDMRTLPSMGFVGDCRGMDGFFAARMIKTGENGG